MLARNRNILLFSDTCLLIVHAVLPIELVNTSARLGSLLLAGVERMALGTDLNVDIFLRGACHKCIPAVAGHSCLIILWMDTLSHDLTSQIFYSISIVIKNHDLPCKQLS